MIRDYLKRAFILFGFLLLEIPLAQVGLFASWAAFDSPDRSTFAISNNQPVPPEPWYKNIETQWGGHTKARGTVSWPDDESIFHPVGAGAYYDGNIEARLKNKLFFGEWGYFETHYEAVISGGDTRNKRKELKGLFPDLFKDGFPISHSLEDDRRLMDLTKTIEENDDLILSHRLDRFSLTLLPGWGVVCIGRQAVTWGNGLLFNPMDLFNPFSPIDIERDYKIGDDMVSTQFSINNLGDFQFLYVPRRDPVDGDVEWDQSSLAGKIHISKGATEFDILATIHYKDSVVGLGSAGYLGDAAWRLDVLWTFLDEDSDSDDYLSLVANMDYSWIWWEKNFYGFLEFYFDGLGNDRYPDAFTDPEILERLNRGELFTLGRTYLSCHIRVELHPLFNVFFTVINNLADPSGTLQPRATWDIAQNFQMTFGGNMVYGGRGTEFGGFKIPGTNFLNKAPNSAFLWLTHFF